MFDRLRLRLKLWSRSRYILKARYAMAIIGVKYVTMLVYERTLDGEIPIIETKVPVVIKLLSAEDVNGGHYKEVKLATGDDSLYHAETLRRLSEANICLIAVAGDRVAGFAWLYMQKRKWEPDIEAEITFGSDESLIYDRVVFPEFRKNGIGEKLNEERMRFLKSKGFKKVYGYVQTDNIPSIKSLEAVGFRPTKIITCFRLFCYKRIRERPIDRTALNEK